MGGHDSNMTDWRVKITISRLCKCSSANASSTLGTIQSRPSPITSAPIIFSGRPISRSRIRPGRGPEKPSIIVSRAYPRKTAKECCGETRRSFIGYRVETLSGGTKTQALPLESRWPRRSRSNGPATENLKTRCRLGDRLRANRGIRRHAGSNCQKTSVDF